MTQPADSRAGDRAVAAAVAEAEQRGAHPHVVDTRTVTAKREVLAAIAGALAFPEWFGHNLDALHDCLVDLSWLPAGEHVLVWVGAHRLRERDPGTAEAVRQTVADAVEATRSGERPVSVVLLD
ncbi:barstar family protein [Goodfellowiella coeruleoviolacea]|uniref:Barstar (Barnase inhibitor) n=1 Tax=Goodfellowiella coeruleoviolacea TaxID=334858 RepID=A0AAE3GBN1_9PSEU|nr:barstar family protein [Goodfellowiella coeruleoviolacea]MCP2165160.1 Barstar (barnase inhibitor) [Goodfellowiella coeruleoviolacea]